MERVLNSSQLGELDERQNGRMTELTVTPGIAGSRMSTVQVMVLDGLPEPSGD